MKCHFGFVPCRCNQVSDLKLYFAYWVIEYKIKRIIRIVCNRRILSANHKGRNEFGKKQELEEGNIVNSFFSVRTLYITYIFKHLVGL